MEFRKQYDDEARSAAAERCWIDCSNDPGVTDQSLARDMDINALVARFAKGTQPKPGAVAAMVAQLRGIPLHVPEVGTVDTGPDLSFHDMMNVVKRAELTFMDLPAKVRTAFDNRAANMLDVLRLAQAGDKEALKRLGDVGIVDVPAPAAVPDAKAAGVAPEAPLAPSAAS